MKQQTHKSRIIQTLLTIVIFACAVWTMSALAGEAEDLARMQAELNAEVMEKPFSVADEAKINKYMTDAMAKDLKPEVTTAPKGWQRGWTCANVYSRGWRTYRNCRYYRRYHGYYW